jgi:hypothetical protein
MTIIGGDKNAYDVRVESFQVVPSLTTDAFGEQTVPNGEVWQVIKFQGSAAYVADTTAALYWDHGGAAEQLLASTHGDQAFELEATVTGDGTKKLSVVLDNQSPNAQAMGGVFTSRRVG